MTLGFLLSWCQNVEFFLCIQLCVFVHRLLRLPWQRLLHLMKQLNCSNQGWEKRTAQALLLQLPHLISLLPPAECRAVTTLFYRCCSNVLTYDADRENIWHKTLTLDLGWCVKICSRTGYCWPCWQISHDCHAHIARCVCVVPDSGRTRQACTLGSAHGCWQGWSKVIVNLKTFDCQRMMLPLFKVVCVTLSESIITVFWLALCSSYHTTDTFSPAPWQWPWPFESGDHDSGLDFILLPCWISIYLAL